MTLAAFPGKTLKLAIFFKFSVHRLRCNRSTDLRKNFCSLKPNRVYRKLLQNKSSISQTVTKKHVKKLRETSGILQRCSVVFVAVLLNQETGRQESIVISHMK